MVFAEKIRDHKLPMKPIKAEYNHDGSRLTFYFAANGRVDFRQLVRDLASWFRCRIELRQIGPREEARLIGSLGRCGRPLCCSTWLPQFADVTITMAKNQDVSLNPTKNSGACGKLLCCLSYEDDFYRQVRSELPRLGQQVKTSMGPGYVHALNILRETVRSVTTMVRTSNLLLRTSSSLVVRRTSSKGVAVHVEIHPPRAHPANNDAPIRSSCFGCAGDSAVVRLSSRLACSARLFGCTVGVSLTVGHSLSWTAMSGARQLARSRRLAIPEPEMLKIPVALEAACLTAFGFNDPHVALDSVYGGVDRFRQVD